MAIQLSWFRVTLADGVEHKVFASDENAARILVLFDTDLVPANLRGQYPTVTPWVDEAAPTRKVKSTVGTFKVGDSMVNAAGRTFVRHNS